MMRSVFYRWTTVVTLLICITACKMYYTPEKVAYTVQSADANMAEGKRMTMLMCGPCHYNANTKKYTGMKMDDVPGFVGKIYAKNITRDSIAGAGAYTEAEMAYLIKTGIARDGKLMPYMMRPNISQEDLMNIISYLRSDDELVSPSKEVPGSTKYTPMGKFGISRSKPLPWTASSPSKPAGKDMTALGKYLVDNLSCYDCHSKSFMSIDKQHPENSKGFMGGGNKLKDRSGKTIASPNLTFHATGIGAWTEADFLRAMKQGVSKDNSIIGFPMPMYSDLTDMEVQAIYGYLKSLPAIDNKVKRKD